LWGQAELISQEKNIFDEVVSRVATKGGITKEGIKVLGSDLLKIYDNR